MQWGQRGIEDSGIVSWTMGCERPAWRAGTWSQSSGEPEKGFMWGSIQMRVLECPGLDVGGGRNIHLVLGAQHKAWPIVGTKMLIDSVDRIWAIADVKIGG